VQQRVIEGWVGRAKTPPWFAWFTDRLHRERITVRAIVECYCRVEHSAQGPGLCAACASLFDYASVRLERCRFQARKPTCFNCPVHCYAPGQRQQIREMMKKAGPQMLWRHPLLTLLHFCDGRKTVDTGSLSGA